MNTWPSQFCIGPAESDRMHPVGPSGGRRRLLFAVLLCPCVRVCVRACVPATLRCAHAHGAVTVEATVAAVWRGDIVHTAAARLGLMKSRFCCARGVAHARVRVCASAAGACASRRAKPILYIIALGCRFSVCICV